MRPNSFLQRQMPAVLLIAFVATCSIALGEPAEPQLASAKAAELWRKGSDEILAGNFSAAASTLEQVQKIEPGNKEVAETLSWMRDAKSLAESRERLRSKTYDYFVAQAQKYAKEAREAKAESETGAAPKVPVKKKTSDKAKTAAKKSPAKVDKGEKSDKSEQDAEGDDEDDKGYKWSKALFAAQAAMLNAKEDEAFRAEPWLDEIIDNVKGEIERHKSAKEWRDALVLYDYLQKIYPKNKEYQNGFTYCSKRAHLDFVYGPKSNWRNDLREVAPPAIGQILERIEDDYVEEVDFRKLATAGLEHLMLLSEADSLTTAFPTLGDKDLVKSFVTRIRGLIKSRVQARGTFAARHVRALFTRVLEVNNETLRLPEAVLVDEFVSGMFEPMDEFTSVIWPSEVDDFNKHTRGDFVGVGIQITSDPGKFVRVESPLEDSPAFKAGIKPGDLITAVDGKSTQEMTITQAVSTITGEPGTKVTLTIKDTTNDESRDVVLVREHIKIRTVKGVERNDHKTTGWDYFLDPESKIAYVRVIGFMDKTVDDLEAALEQMRNEGARGLILDLRFNPGGLLTSAVHMCELFMKKGDHVVMTKGRTRQQNMEISAKAEDNYHDLPLVILVNEYSASASEIVAGALSGLKEALIVGTRSFGKGSVQNLIPISENQAYLKLTTAKYYVPDLSNPEMPWYCLHRDKTSETWGVEPNIEVKVIPQELNKILRLRREKDVLKGRDQNKVPKDVLERRPTSEPAEELPQDDAPNTDPQIVAALNILRVKLMSNQPWVLAPKGRPALSQADVDKTKVLQR